jgi:hypothetical protein
MERKRACALRFLLPRCSGVYMLDEAPLILLFSPSIFNIKHSQAPSPTLTPPQASLHFLRHHLRRHSSSGILRHHSSSGIIVDTISSLGNIAPHRRSSSWQAYPPTPTSITLTIDRLVVASSRHSHSSSSSKYIIITVFLLLHHSHCHSGSPSRRHRLRSSCKHILIIVDSLSSSI